MGGFFTIFKKAVSELICTRLYLKCLRFLKVRKARAHFPIAFSLHFRISVNVIIPRIFSLFLLRTIKPAGNLLCSSISDSGAIGNYPQNIYQDSEVRSYCLLVSKSRNTLATAEILSGKNAHAFLVCGFLMKSFKKIP